MANKKRRRHHKRRRSNRPRKGNPFFAPRKRHHRRRRNTARRVNRHHRRRNPFGVSNVGGLVKDVLYAGAGAVGTRLIPNLILKDKNSGLMGYAANAATAVGLGFIAEKVGGPGAQQMVLIGGGVAIVARVFEDYLGSQLSAYTVPQGLLGAYGDSRYDLAGLGGTYTPSYFAVPTVSGPGLVTAPPMAPAPTVKQVQAITSMSGLGRYGSRYGSRYAN